MKLLVILFIINNSCFFFAAEIDVSPISPEIHNDVLKIARKRHQSGQMCQEVLNLLSKGEITINMALDNENPETRLPIPLIYRPLRKLMYGVLFGPKLTAKEEEEEKDEDTKKPIKEDDENKEVEPTVHEVVEDVANSEDSESKALETKKEETKNNAENEEEEIEVVEEEEKMIEEISGFYIKEWSVYGDKDLKNPDKVLPKGLYLYLILF